MALEPVRRRASHILNSTGLNLSKFRAELLRLFGMGAPEESMTVAVTSFGFKHGIPIDADLVFDVRFLPNPYYVQELRPRTGLDDGVRDYVFSGGAAGEFLEKLQDLVGFLLPKYVEEGKTALVVAVGCTGGHHRSVAIAHALAAYIRGRGYPGDGEPPGPGQDVRSGQSKLEGHGQGVVQPFPQRTEGKGQKQNAGNQHQGQGLLPGAAVLLAEGMGKQSGKAQTGGQSEGQIGHQPGHDAACGGDEAGGRHDFFKIHACPGEQTRDNQDQVHHGTEGGTPAPDLSARVVPRWERRKNPSSCFISPHLLYCGKDVHSYEQDCQDIGDRGIFLPFPMTRLMAV